MSYIGGFLAAVPVARRAAYEAHAGRFAQALRAHIPVRAVETWEDDVPAGEVTDFRRAVLAGADEAVVFSWIEYPDRAAHDAVFGLMDSDPDLQALGASLPFDGQRLVFGSFDPIVDVGGGFGSWAGGASAGESAGASAGASAGESATASATAGRTGYVDGFVVAVPVANRQAYQALAAGAAPVFVEYGARRVVETWASEVPHGRQTDFYRAVQAGPDETVVFAWIEWPSREVRDAAWIEVSRDARMQPDAARRIFDGKRMIWGGFRPLLDVRVAV